MDATLGGRMTRSTASTVRAFLLRQPPDYPERLRRIILSSADDLFRAAAAAPGATSTRQLRNPATPR
jgi:hypothetical protein